MKGNHQKVPYRQIFEDYTLNKSKDKKHHAGRTAKRLGISRRTVQRAIRAHGVEPSFPERIYRIRNHPIKKRSETATSTTTITTEDLTTNSEYNGGLFQWRWT